MEEDMMMMNRSKQTSQSDDEFSWFIDLITNAIQTQTQTQGAVRTSTISIPVEFTSLTENDDEEVGNHTDENLSCNGNNRDDIQVDINHEEKNNLN